MNKLKQIIMELKLICNKCYWIGTEDELSMIGTTEVNNEEVVVNHELKGIGAVTRLKDVEVEEYIDGCPNCLTDNYLMDIK